VYTSEAGNNFCPFIVVLPLEVLEDGGRGKDSDTPSIFSPDKERNNVARMKTPYYDLFKSYIYDKNDEKAFFSDSLRRSLGIKAGTASFLRSIRIPKKMRVSDSNVVTFMIDPLRVFHDMLTFTDNSNNAQFSCDVTAMQKIRDGEYIYSVTRVVNKGKNKKYADTFIHEINKKMQGRR
jgi:hypothetical protein